MSLDETSFSRREARPFVSMEHPSPKKTWLVTVVTAIGYLRT